MNISWWFWQSPPLLGYPSPGHIIPKTLRGVPRMRLGVVMVPIVPRRKAVESLFVLVHVRVRVGVNCGGITDFRHLKGGLSYMVAGCHHGETGGPIQGG